MGTTVLSLFISKNSMVKEDPMMTKGQSAIEYLSTYGWMLLAVAVVGGIAFTNISNSCTRSSSDFYTDAIDIRDFGVDGSNNFLISLENSRYQELRIQNINITIDDTTEEHKIGGNISSGNTRQLSLNGYRTTSGCNTLELGINYDRGSLNGQEVTGIIRAPIGFNN